MRGPRLLGVVLASACLWQSGTVGAQQVSIAHSGTAATTESTPEGRSHMIGRLAREGLQSANLTIDTIIVLGSASYPGQQAKDDFSSAVAGIQQGVGTDLQVLSRLMVTTGPGRMFGALGLTSGNQAANADALLDAGKGHRLAALVLDDESLTECLAAIQYIRRYGMANPVQVILASNVSEKTLARYRDPGVALIVLYLRDDRISH